METRNLYRDNERAAVAAFHNGKLLYIVTYFFGANLFERGRVTVCNDGTVITSGDVDVIKDGD